MLRLSQLYGMKIYDTEGKFLGDVKDIVLNMESGTVVRLLMKKMVNIKPDELTSFIRKNSMLYKRIISAKDIIVASHENKE